MIALALVKLHVKIEGDVNEEDVYLQHLLDSALDAFCVLSNRTLIVRDAILPEPLGNTLRITKSIEQGALLMIGHWYANREAVVVGVIGAELPLATQRLWSPYRWGNLS